MKLLLVGPYPPPHGGISVHVATAERLLSGSGARCRVLEVGRRPDAGGARTAAGAGLALLARVRRHAGRGWTIHLHTNGHNPRSWLVALACGLAARRAPGRVLTVHSGMAPGYLAGGAGRRLLARLALAPFDRVVCVNREIRDAVAALGVGAGRLRLAPAWLDAAAPAADPAAPAEPAAAPPPALAGWLGRHRPLLTATLAFRPEYGFDVLLAALGRVAPRHPKLGCLVLGGGEPAAEAEARARLAAAGLGERVLLAGDVDHRLCLELIGRSELFVRPTRIDGDALSVREALALGVPVVASDVGCRPPGAVLFPAGDAAALAARIDEALAAGSAAARRRTAGEGPATEAAGAPGGAAAAGASGAPEGDAGPGGLDGLLATYRGLAGGRNLGRRGRR